MILTVTLNPCIDRTLSVDALNVGGHNVVQRVQNVVAGKGIDVNVVLHNLGIDTRAAGFDFIRNGHQVSDFLSSMNIPFYGVDVDAELRVNTKVFDENACCMTELNCKGPQMTMLEENAFMEVFEKALERVDVLVADGSVPPGIGTDIYARMINIAKKKNVYSVLDASGELLEKGLSARPDMVKPNRTELEQLLRRSLNSIDECIDGCHELMKLGAGAVCLSLGSDGCILADSEGAWFSEGLDIEVRGFQGAGDSVVAGICIAVEKGLGGMEQLRSGVACAHGSLIREGTDMCTRESYDEMLALIPVRKIY
ncbi:MAG: 1-phosphofructokinase family hexose kinase [Eubacteriales bacterium]|nr:1-phosphofructokinase family hexose kinase [Eubacteriales bacterium]